LPEPRRRLGGVGTPKHEVLAYVPRHTRGIPNYWIDDWEVAYYNGRLPLAEGLRREAGTAKGDFKGEAIDPDDPPLYESQAAYLERHGLFLPGERRRLRKADFEPEPVLAEVHQVDALLVVDLLQPLGGA
jgi:hypothetical protein